MSRKESIGVQKELTESVSRMIWKIIDNYIKQSDTVESNNKLDLNIESTKDLVIVSVINTKYRVAFKSIHNPNISIVYIKDNDIEYIMLITEYQDKIRYSEGDSNGNIRNE